MAPASHSGSEPPPIPSARPLAPPQAVPVFNCLVFVSPANAAGIVNARVANLPEVTGAGSSEREALQQVVANFKQVAARYLAQGGTPPFIEPGVPEAGEQQRLIAVHL